MSFDTEIREALLARTADLTLPPDLLTGARRAGRRRRQRGRVLLATAPVAVVAVVVAGLFAAQQLAYSPPGAGEVASALSPAERTALSRPTAGDLGDDDAYLAAVTAAWRANLSTSVNADRGIFEHPVGEPKVVWAGGTEAGNAAIVGAGGGAAPRPPPPPRGGGGAARAPRGAPARRAGEAGPTAAGAAAGARPGPHGRTQLEREGPALLWGFAGPGADGAPRVVADGYPVPGAPDTEAALIGADRQVLLAWDRGHRAEVSWGPVTYRADGSVSRTWAPLRFTDGVALADRPAGTNPLMVRLRVPADTAEVGNLSDDPYAQPELATTLLWTDLDGEPVWRVGADPAAAWPGGLPVAQEAYGELEKGLQGKVPTYWPDVRVTVTGRWWVAGTLPDGRRLMAGELALDADPARVWVVLGTGPDRQVLSRWSGRATDPVPVMVELPGGQGWLVAAAGQQLSWRTGDGPWTAAGRDAALLPATATEVRAGTAAAPLR